MSEIIPEQQTSEHEVKRSFWAELAHRRVPQVLGLYMAGSWTFMEFFESIIGRHNLSTYWADIALLIIGLMLPTVILLAYRHGAPGAQSWSKVEKIGIPVNLIAVFAIVYLNFAGKDLGDRVEMIEGISPDGSTVKVVRPKEDYRKRLMIGYFKLRSKSLDQSMSYGISHALAIDLEQSPYTTTFDPLDFSRPLIESDFTDFQVPLPLMLKISRDNRIKFYVTGELSETPNNEYVIEAEIYDVVDGKRLIELKTAPHADIFSAVDELTPRIKQAVNLPDFIINESPDLPIEEQITANLEAYQYYINGLRQYVLLSQQNNGEQLLNQAVEQDKTFALALAQLAIRLLNGNRITEGLGVLKRAEKHDYRLNVNSKFYLVTVGHLYNGQLAKAYATLEQWITLYPESLDAWRLKAGIHQNLNQRLEAIAAYDKLLELDPYAINYYINKGDLLFRLGRLDDAIASYNAFAEKNPSNAEIHIRLGDIHRRQGNFELSNKQYMQAQVLEINSLEADRKLLENIKRQGDFAEAERGYLQLFDEANSEITEYEISLQLRDLYRETGQISTALIWFDKSYELLESYATEYEVIVRKMISSSEYVDMGFTERGKALLETGHNALSRYDNDIFKANLFVSQTMFDVFSGTSSDPFPTIDAVQKDIQRYIGNGSDHILNMIRATAHYMFGNYTETITLLTAYKNNHPNQQADFQERGLWLMLADSLRKTDQLNKAIEIYEKVLVDYPAHPMTHYALAKAYVDMGDATAAEVALRVALKGWSNADEQFKEKIEAENLLKLVTAENS